jgi:hypothetical protein
MPSTLNIEMPFSIIWAYGPFATLCYEILRAASVLSAVAGLAASEFLGTKLLIHKIMGGGKDLLNLLKLKVTYFLTRTGQTSRTAS